MDITPFKQKIWLSSPTMHGEELEYVAEAIRSNWVTTTGQNIQELERMMAERCGAHYAVGLASGTSALHMAIRFAGERLYGPDPYGSLRGKKVFCSDMTFSASVNPILYEGGEPVFIDAEYETWNMDPRALEQAFAVYPDVKLVVLAHLYGTPAKMDEISAICAKHGALIVEDAAESLGSTYRGRPCGSLGDFNVMSFNGNKVITGSSGGMLLSDDPDVVAKVRKWSTQSRDAAPWYQHSELGYNYRMSNIVAGIARGNFLHLDEHLAQKRALYKRYSDGLKDLPVQVNPVPEDCFPNHWLSCILLDRDAMCPQIRDDHAASFKTEPGKSCPAEILDTLKFYNAEGRPIWKPMHMQPIFNGCHVFSAEGLVSTLRRSAETLADEDIFERGLCLPSDNKMTPEQQDIIIEIIRRCFA